MINLLYPDFCLARLSLTGPEEVVLVSNLNEASRHYARLDTFEAVYIDLEAGEGSLVVREGYFVAKTLNFVFEGDEIVFDTDFEPEQVILVQNALNVAKT